MNLDFTKLGGLIPAVVQDASDGEVLMVGFMNEESLSSVREAFAQNCGGLFVSPHWRRIRYTASVCGKS